VNISVHCTYAEAIKSQAAIRLGIDNKPNEEQLAAMRLVAERCYEPIVDNFGKLVISSFFRNPETNKAVGGSKTSQHMKGEAIDVDADGSKHSNAAVYKFVLDHLDFDQLIWEFGDDNNPAWVHVSYKATGNRKMTLRV